MAWHFCTKKNTPKKMKKYKSELCDFYMMIIHPPLKLCLKMQRFPPYKWDVSGQWHLRLTKLYTTWLLYVYKIYSILKIQNITYRNILDVPQVRTTTYGKRSFRFAAVSLWNNLPDHFKTENSFAHFRSLVQSWTGSDCRCSACK